MKPIAIVYGSTGNNTREVAKKLAAQLPGSTLMDVASLKISDLDAYDNLIFGTSTWGVGEIQDDWDGFLSQLKKSNMEGKIVALFGLGDSASFPDTFTNGMGILFKALQSTGCTFVGSVSTAGYDFEDSLSVQGDHFVGLALDEDNESEQTDARISAWLEVVLPGFK